MDKVVKLIVYLIIIAIISVCFYLLFWRQKPTTATVAPGTEQQLQTIPEPWIPNDGKG